ncbi:hypothetical protein K9M41_04115 [Candidatus Gracilibacteria bacterium]|nr:hypothetical protein [Candidatus Gracilibacteria bacterium]
MKKILIVAFVIITATVTAFEVEASNKTSRLRGSNRSTTSYLQNIEKAASAIVEKWTRRPYLKRNSRSMTSPTTSSARYTRRSTSSTSSRRSTIRSYVSPYSSRGVAQEVQEQANLKVFSATSVPFTILLPNTFSLLEDNLGRSSGSLKLRRSNVIIEIIATEDICEGGVTFVRNCLQQKSDSYLREFKKNLPPLELSRNESVSLDPNNLQLTSGNRGWFVELSSLDYKAGQLTFFDPINDFVWLMRITSAGKGKTILDDNKILYQVFSSLLELDSQKEKVQREVSKIVTNRRSTVGTSPRTKNPVIFGESKITRFVAEKVPFEMELPQNFELVSDNLDWNEGAALFESEEGSIELTATNVTCVDPTPRIKRQCMEEEAAKFAKELREEFPQGNVLQDVNIQIQLEDIANTNRNLRRSSTSKNHLGRLLTLRISGERIGIFTFVEPQNGYVWKMRIDVPEGRDYFLSDVRQKQKVFSSLFFRSEE